MPKNRRSRSRTYPQVVPRQAKLIARLCIDEVLQATDCRAVRLELHQAKAWINSIDVKKDHINEKEKL